MKKIVTLLFIAALVVFLMGCPAKIDKSMVAGTYTANHSKGKNFVILNLDGTYTYQYTSKDGKELRNQNKWSFVYDNGKPTITFSRFVFGMPEYGSKEPGFWVVEVKKSLNGELRLYIDTDLNYYFAKIKSKMAKEVGGSQKNGEGKDGRP